MSIKSSLGNGTRPGAGFPQVNVPIESQTLQNYVMTTSASYDWVEISTTGTECSFSNNDDSYVAVSLPFSFSFYGTTYDTLYMCTNGFVSFVHSTAFSNTDFPSSSNYLMIAPYWDDLDAIGSSNVYYKHDSGRGCFVVEYSNYVTHSNNYLVGTFEVLLYTEGSIKFQYQSLSRAQDYTCGLNYGYDLTYYNQYAGLYAGMMDFAILFTYTGGSSFPGGYDFPLTGAPDEDFESLASGASLSDTEVWSVFDNPALIPSVLEDWPSGNHYADFSDSSYFHRYYSVADVPSGSGTSTWWVQFEVTWQNGQFDFAVWDGSLDSSKVIQLRVGEAGATGTTNLSYYIENYLVVTAYTITAGIPYRITVEYVNSPYPSHYNVYVGQYRVATNALPTSSLSGDVTRISFETTYEGYNEHFEIDDIELSWTTGSWHPAPNNVPVIVGTVVGAIVAIIVVLGLVAAAVKASKKSKMYYRPGAATKPVARTVSSGMKATPVQPRPMAAPVQATAPAAHSQARTPVRGSMGRSIWDDELARGKPAAPQAATPRKAIEVEQPVDISKIEVGPMRPLGTSAFAELGTSGSPAMGSTQGTGTVVPSPARMHARHDSCFIEGNDLGEFTYECPKCGTLYCKECTDVMARFQAPCVACKTPLLVHKELVLNR